MARDTGASQEEVQWPQPMQRVQRMAASSLDAVPDKYVRPASQRAPLHAPLANLPVIDLSGLADPRTRNSTVQQIGDAFAEWGVFYAINHGIPLSLVERVQQVSRELFDLPYEEKEAYANKPGLPVGYGSHLGVSNSGTMDWGDYFFHPLRSSVSYDADSWPAKPAAYREIVTEYGEKVYSLMRTLLLAVAENLQVDFSSVDEAFGGDDGIRLNLRVNYYPPCPQPALTLGVSSHSDPGVLTVLVQDEVGGLQVRKDGTWYSVGTKPDSLVVNVADHLEIFSNGRYNSVEHQVVPNINRVRMSWAAFLSPALESVISPAQQLVNEQHPPLYGRSLYGEYISNVYAKGNNGKDYLLSHSLQK